ncbi:MAG: DNA polymerase III subunit gamma/tau [Candidatus Handelsmanbacteria bacterium]|nr:DNA polymerase III subunit gamma/tau [Candidatus Handelsmanbacteria bacterium]
MAYQVTARKWRPRRFDQVVGQEHITTTLKNALSSGRVAQCYLFCGSRGVGKTTTARILAKALNCARPDGADPCGECPSCRSIAEGTSMDVLEIDGASNNKVEDVRELREVVRYAPTEGSHKIYIIDEVHMLSTSAFNALLKTLEEPPPRVVFVFATTEVQQVPETILSRCQRFNFRRIPAGQIARHLQAIAQAEGIAVEEDALFLLAGRADGSLRDAESLFDQVVSFDQERVSTSGVHQVLGLVDRSAHFELIGALAEADASRVLGLIGAVVAEGGEVEEFVLGLVEHLRHLLFVKVQGGGGALDVAEADRTRYEQLAGLFAEEDLLRMMRAVLDLAGELPRSLYPRFRAELALVRLARMGRAVEVGQLLARLKALESGPGPGPAPGGGPGPAIEPAAPGQAAALRVAPAPPSAPPHPTGQSILPPRKGAAEPARQPASQAPDPPPPGVELSPDRLEADWGGLVQEVRRSHPSLGIFLQGAALVGLEGRVLRLSFAPEDSFASKQVEKNREVIEGLCARRWGQPLRLECAVRTGDAPPARQETREADPTLKSVLDAFDGELV